MSEFKIYNLLYLIKIYLRFFLLERYLYYENNNLLRRIFFFVLIGATLYKFEPSNNITEPALALIVLIL